jgi:hypothetical protein
VEFLPAIEPGLDRRHILAEREHREQTTALLLPKQWNGEHPARNTCHFRSSSILTVLAAEAGRKRRLDVRRLALDRRETAQPA